MTEPRKKILIVDDDQSILEILSDMMAIFGHDYMTARDGVEAVEILKKDHFHIVITDMMMPNMDGMELLKYIHANYPSIKIIIVTGYDRTFTFTDVIREGASDFISKPFNTDELEAKINRIIREIDLLNQLEILSISDSLTGLYNRRHFDTKIFEEVRRAHRQNHDLFLAVIDVDNLKEMNDKYGHLAGDKLLKTVGDIIKHCIRENVDWPFRYGGDEFCVILTQVSRDQAIKTTERLIQNFNEKKLPLTGLSIGLAQFIRSEEAKWTEDIADLVRRSDAALYKAKHSGRNRVVVDNHSGLNNAAE
ncbi:diguanylate cyclase [Thermodesulfobacteriota bacterium]